MNKYTSKTDGLDHINIYSDAKTYIGHILSNFYHDPNFLVETPDGYFKSIETYWYWLGIPDNDECKFAKDEICNLYGYEAKAYGRKIQEKYGKNMLDKSVFESKISTAIWNKCMHYIELFNNETILNSDIKFVHYYSMFNKAFDTPQQDLGGFWVDTINKFKQWVKENRNKLILDGILKNSYNNLGLRKMYLDYDGIKVYLKTSYFYKIRYFKENFVPISICLWDPKWYEGMNYKGFVPKKYNPNEDCENCAKQHKDNPLYDGNLNCNYISNYRNQLSHYNFNRTFVDIMERVKLFYSNKGIDAIKMAKDNGYRLNLVFIGYEVPSKKCSERFELSRWFLSNGINCDEI